MIKPDNTDEKKIRHPVSKQFGIGWRLFGLCGVPYIKPSVLLPFLDFSFLPRFGVDDKAW